MIEVKRGMFTVKYTEMELELELDKLQFFMDSFLVLLNPKVAENSDLPFDRATCIEYAKELFDKSDDYSKDFIQDVFSEK